MGPGMASRAHPSVHATMSSASTPKKRKLRLAERTGANAGKIGDLVTTTTTTSPQPRSAAAEAEAAAGRLWTVTVALPGSIVDNAQTHELRSQLVGQVARACAIFNVDEIVVFKTDGDAPPPPNSADGPRSNSAAKRTAGSVFMARLLQYLECPQYLRKHIFPVHPDLRAVGLLAPLDAPHHLRIDEACVYREAVVVPPGSAGSRDAAANTAAAAAAAGGGGDADGDGGDGADGAAGSAAAGGSSSCAYTGLRKEMRINHSLPVGTRVTLKMPSAGSSNARLATVVPPKEPREGLGLYWGYEVRVADNLAAVWSECPHAEGYDLSIGTSEHGTASLHHQSRPSGVGGGGAATVDFELPPFKHALIVFGGVEGLETVVSAEEELAEVEDDVPSLFDHYLNLCPQQGSRTIRTEEALLVGLAALKPHLERGGLTWQNADGACE